MCVGLIGPPSFKTLAECLPLSSMFSGAFRASGVFLLNEFQYDHGFLLLGVFNLT